MHFGVVQVVVEDRDLELEVARSVGAMMMLVKTVRPILLDILAGGDHLTTHSSVSVSANGGGVLGGGHVNERHHCPCVLSGFVEKSVEARDFAPMIHFGE